MHFHWVKNIRAFIAPMTIVMGTLVFANTTAVRATNTTPREALGFVQSGEVSSGAWTTDIKPYLADLTTIAYFSINVNSNGALLTSGTYGGGYVTWESSQSAALIAAAHSAGDSVLMGLTLDNSNLSTFLDSGSYTNSINESITAMQSMNADGIAIDFEYSNSTPSQSEFTTYIQDLHSALQSQAPASEDIVVSTYASAAQNGGATEMWNLPALSPFVSAFDVMAYDMNYPQATGAPDEPTAPLNGSAVWNDTQVLSEYNAVVPSSQVLLGIPYYSYLWCTQNASQNAPVNPTNYPTYTYSSLLSELSSAESYPDFTKGWNSTYDVNYASWFQPNSSSSCPNSYTLDSMTTTGYFPNNPVIRGITLNSAATGGLTVDEYGGIHPYGTGQDNYNVSGYFPGRAIIEGIAANSSGTGGYTVDAYGGIHPFGNAAEVPVRGYYPGNPIIKGIALNSTGTGGVTVDEYGGIHPFGNVSEMSVAAYYPGRAVIVGVSLNAAGTGGVTVDEYGGIHPFGVVANARVSGYYPGNPVIKGVVLNAAGNGGYTVDVYGGIHPFGNEVNYTVSGYFPGQKIVTGIALNSTGTGGITVDAYGGVHSFGDVAPSGAEPCSNTSETCGSYLEVYYDTPESLAAKYALVNSDNERGVAVWSLGYDDGSLEPLLGSSFTLVHSPSAMMDALPSSETQTEFTLNWTLQSDVPASAYDIWVTTNGKPWLLWTKTSSTSINFYGNTGSSYGFYAEALNQDGQGNGPPSNTAVTQSSTTVSTTASSSLPFTGLYAVTGYGNLLPASSSPQNSSTWSWSIARGLTMDATGHGGIVVDGYGGLHAFGDSPGATSNAYWPGNDIVKGIAEYGPSNGTGAYMLDAYGGVHPVAIGSNALPASPVVSQSWSGDNIARGIAVFSNGSGGVVVNGYGVVAPFRTGSNAMPANPTIHGTWSTDVARGVVLLPGSTAASYSGYVLDYSGGIHPFASPGTTMPSVPSITGYWAGQDVARGIVLLPGSSTQGYVITSSGGFYPFGGAPAVFASSGSQSSPTVVGGAIG